MFFSEQFPLFSKAIGQLTVKSLDSLLQVKIVFLQSIVIHLDDIKFILKFLLNCLVLGKFVAQLLDGLILLGQHCFIHFFIPLSLIVCLNFLQP